MTLEMIISRHLENNDFVNKIRDKISDFTMELENLDEYDIDTDQMNEIVIDSETLFRNFLSTKFEVQHSLNRLYNDNYFADFDNKVIPYGYDPMIMDHSYDVLIQKIVKIIIISRILSGREIEIRSQIPLNCAYCDYSLTADDSKCPICGAETGNSNIDNYNDIRSSSRRNESSDESSLPVRSDRGYGINSIILDSLSRCICCQNFLSDDNRICLICDGDNSRQNDKPEDKSNEKILWDKDHADMTQWKCMYCNKINSSEISYCLICDAFAPFVKGWICRMCDTKNDRFAEQCGQCQEQRNKEAEVIRFDISINKMSEITVDQHMNLVNRQKVVKKEYDYAEKRTEIRRKEDVVELSCQDCKIDCTRPWKICETCKAIVFHLKFDDFYVTDGIYDAINKGIQNFKTFLGEKRNEIDLVESFVKIDEMDCGNISLDDDVNERRENLSQTEDFDANKSDQDIDGSRQDLPNDLSFNRNTMDHHRSMARSVSAHEYLDEENKKTEIPSFHWPRKPDEISSPRSTNGDVDNCHYSSLQKIDNARGNSCDQGSSIVDDCAMNNVNGNGHVLQSLAGLSFNHVVYDSCEVNKNVNDGPCDL